MALINYLGLFFFGLITLILWLVKSMKNIGPFRASGIGGYVAGIIQFFVIYYEELWGFNELSGTFLLGYGIITAIGIIMTILPALRPRTNLEWWRFIPKFCCILGICIGLLSTILGVAMP